MKNIQSFYHENKVVMYDNMNTRTATCHYVYNVTYIYIKTDKATVTTVIHLDISGDLDSYILRFALHGDIV